jgi:catechol 2,3-dioxygenase-like lactoylglutathione lyase family enzyme
MFSHVHVGVTDFTRSHAFYEGLGFEGRVCRPEESWAGWAAPGTQRPFSSLACRSIAHLRAQVTAR